MSPSQTCLSVEVQYVLVELSGCFQRIGVLSEVLSGLYESTAYH